MNETKQTPTTLDGVSSILLNVYQQMIDDGTVEKIAREQIAKMIQGTLSDAVQWNGPARQKFKERIEPLLIDAIERSELQNMTEKLTGVINQALQASAAGSYKEICDGIRALASAPRFERNQTLKLSEIYQAYIHSCEETFSDAYFDRSKLDRDEHGNYSVIVYCKMTVEKEKRYFGDGDYTLTFSPECEDLDEDEHDFIIDNTFCVKVHEYRHYGEQGVRRLMWVGSLDALSLRRLPEFALYLQAAKDAGCNIVIDTEDRDDDIEIELEE